MLRGLQDRVMSLATIHRELFHTAGLADIHVDELMTSIVRQITVMSRGAANKVDVRTEFAPIRLTPDQAVPAALLVAEAMTSALHEAGTDSEKLPWIEVRLLPTGDADTDTVTLELVHGIGRDIVAPASEAEDNLGRQLLSAFAHQLGATVKEAEDDQTRRLSVTFRVRPLSEAEARAQETVTA
jgi:two-component sensor histidine kinase